MSGQNNGSDKPTKVRKPYETPTLEPVELEEIPNVYALDGRGGGY